MNSLKDSLQSSSIFAALSSYTWPELIFRLIGFYLVLLCARVVYSLYFHPLAQYPGPWLARSGLPISWALLAGIKGRTIYALDDAHKKYGTWVRIGYNELSTLDAKAVPVLYSTSSKWKKTSFYAGFKPPVGPENVFSARQSHDHSYYRRLASSCFAMSSLLTMESRFQNQALALCDMLEEEYAAKDKPADMAWCLLTLAADVVGALAFGRADGFGLITSRAKSSTLLEGAAETNDIGFLVGAHRAWGPRLWSLLGFVVKAPPALKNVLEFGAKNVATRRQRSDDDAAKEPTDDAEERDMISWWLKTKDPQTGDVLTNDKIVDNAMILLIAGSDTTATTLRALMMYVTTTPGVKEKLTAEIDEAFENDACSWPPKYNETVHFEYLQACIKEALRMWPAVGWLLPRQPPAGGATIGQRYFPEGISVGVPARQYHRHAEHAFGSSPEEYRPERWIGGTDEERRLRDSNMLSFGGGSRVCLGKNISLLEISIAFPMLMRKFDFEVVPRREKDGSTRHGGDQHDWNVFSTWFAVQSDMHMTVKTRQHEV